MKYKRILIKDILTVTMDNEQTIDKFSIIIDGERIIRLSKDLPDIRPDDYVIEGENKIAIPGLINGHVHCDITLARGLGDGLSLYEQDFNSLISRRNWFRKEFNAETRYVSRLLQFIELVKGGTTFICDVPFWVDRDLLIAPFKKIGVDGAIVLDYRKDFLTGELFEEKEYYSIIEYLRGNKIMPIIEAPAEEQFDISLLKNIQKWSDETDTFIQMHLAETERRRDYINNKYGKTPVCFLNDIGFLSPKIIGSHGVYINEKEMKILKNEGVKIVNTPIAEMKLSDGIAPIVKFLDNGIDVGIGTDGALWNDSSDMFSEMKSLMLIQRVSNQASSISAYDALYAATRGGAKIFGLEKSLGSIEEGKKASIAVIDYYKPHIVPVYNNKITNIYQAIVSCVRASDIDTVIINGEIIVEDKQLKMMSELEIVEKCQRIGEEKFSVLEDSQQF